MSGILRITRGLFAGIFPAILMLLMVSTAWGLSPCGETVKVVRGDTLDEIASRCHTTVQALVEANPGIDNPNLIAVGMELQIPEDEKPRGEEPQPGDAQYKVSIEPEGGPPGTMVRLTASGFPADTEVLIGVGRLRSEYEIVDRERTNANGTFSAWTQVPVNANPGEEWVFVVALEGQRIDVNSEPFTVRQPTGAPE
jgi:LysM repeat protein